MKKIWLTQALASQRHVAELLRKNLHENVRVIVSHTAMREDIFMVADYHFLEPVAPDPVDYTNWILDKAQSIGADLILAMRRRGDLLDARDRFASAGIRLCCGATTRENLRIADDKAQFTRLMEAHGLPMAKSTLVRNAAELAAAIDKHAIHGPVCVKPILHDPAAKGIYRLAPRHR